MSDDVRIRITAQSDVRAGTSQAEGELKGFADRAKSTSAGVTAAIGGVAGGVAAMALSVVKDAARATFDFFRDSISEAANAQKSTRSLEHALGNLGVAYADMEKPINNVIDGLARQTKFADDDLRDAFTNMVRLTGDVEGSMDNLAVVADLAAARNIDLGSASDLVAKAMAGNTTALTKLFPELKGSADAVGALGAKLKGTAANDAAGFEGRMANVFKQLGEVKEAIGGVVVGSGAFTKILDVVGSALANVASWIGRNSEGFRAFFGAVADVGKAVFDVGRAIFETLKPAFEAIGGTDGGLLNRIIGVLGAASAGFRGLAGAALVAIGHIESKLGAFVEGASKVLRIFGLDVGREYAATLKAVGEKAVSEGGKLIDQARAQHEKSWQMIRTGVRESESGQTAAVRKGSQDRNVIRQKEADDAIGTHLDMEIARAKATREANELLQKTADLLKKQNLSQYAEQWRRVDENVRRFKGDLADTLPPANALAKSIADNQKFMDDNARKAKEQREAFEKTVDSAVSIGRSLLDAGQAAGVLSREAASALNSVMNMGEALAKFGIGSVEGIISVVSGLANILSGIGDGPAAKAVKQNTIALERLTREVGNLNLSATGKTFQGTEAALAATIAKFRNAPTTAAGGGEAAGNLAMKFFKQQLIAQGVSPEDALELLKELGFGDSFANGLAFIKSLPQLKEGLDQTEFGQFGQDFESQLSAFQDSIDIFGKGDAEQLGDLSAIAKKFNATALTQALEGSDPAAALKGLFTQLISGTLDPEAFGDLSGEQFLELIKLLLPLVGEAVPTGIATTTKPPGKVNDFLGGDPGIPVLPSVSGETATRDVLAQLLGTVPAGTGGFDPVIPPLGVRSKLTTAGGEFAGAHFEQRIGSYVAGDQHHIYQITPHDATDPQEIAEIVRQMMANSYTLQRQALGQG